MVVPVKPRPAEIYRGRIAKLTFSTEKNSGIIHPDSDIVRNRNFRNQQTGRGVKCLKDVSLKPEAAPLPSPYGNKKLILSPIRPKLNRLNRADSVTECQFQSGFRRAVGSEVNRKTDRLSRLVWNRFKKKDASPCGRQSFCIDPETERVCACVSVVRIKCKIRFVRVFPFFIPAKKFSRRRMSLQLKRQIHGPIEPIFRSAVGKMVDRGIQCFLPFRFRTEARSSENEFSGALDNGDHPEMFHIRRHFIPDEKPLLRSIENHVMV